MHVRSRWGAAASGQFQYTYAPAEPPPSSSPSKACTVAQCRLCKRKLVEICQVCNTGYTSLLPASVSVIV